MANLDRALPGAIALLAVACGSSVFFFVHGLRWVYRADCVE
jgi:hypothetical protein